MNKAQGVDFGSGHLLVNWIKWNRCAIRLFVFLAAQISVSELVHLVSVLFLNDEWADCTLTLDIAHYQETFPLWIPDDPFIQSSPAESL